MPALTFDR